MTDRIDDLLDAYLETGELPADATNAERDEVESMVRAAGLLRSTADVTAKESEAAKPIARARFERFLMDAEPVIDATPRHVERQPSWFARFFGANRGLRAAGIAAAVGIIAIVAVFAYQNASDTTESAIAQVLEPGDYAEVYGTVASVTGEGDSRTLMVNSEFGVLEVTADDETSIIESNTVHELENIEPGANLLIAGLVGRDRRIAAQTLALAGAEATPVAANVATVRELQRTPPEEFDGQIVLMTLAEDGLGARVVVLAGDGTRYAVRISRLNAGALLVGADRILGAQIHLVRVAGEGTDFYTIRLAREEQIPTVEATPDAPSEETPDAAETRRAAAQTPTAPSDGFSRMTGVILSRDGNVLAVKTDAGELKVVIRTGTQIIFERSGLTRADVVAGNAVIGHEVVVQGGIERITGRFIADVIIVGPKP